MSGRWVPPPRYGSLSRTRPRAGRPRRSRAGPTAWSGERPHVQGEAESLGDERAVRVHQPGREVEGLLDDERSARCAQRSPPSRRPRAVSAFFRSSMRTGSRFGLFIGSAPVPPIELNVDVTRFVEVDRGVRRRDYRRVVLLDDHGAGPRRAIEVVAGPRPESRPTRALPRTRHADPLPAAALRGRRTLARARASGVRSSSETPRARRRTFTISTFSPSWERWP